MTGIITDPIGDMFIRIKNANQRKHKNVLVPFSKKKVPILEILQDEGFINGFEEIVDKKTKFKDLNVHLKYNNNDERVIVGVKRISKPGLKVYVSAENIPWVLSGFGIAIISTSQGIMTDRRARKLNIGGEVIAYVW